MLGSATDGGVRGGGLPDALASLCGEAEEDVAGVGDGGRCCSSCRCALGEVGDALEPAETILLSGGAGGADGGGGGRSKGTGGRGGATVCGGGA